MNLKILITERQKNFLILENTNKQIENVVENSENFFKQVFNEVKKQTNLDFKFLLTWGAGIGAFIEPVADFVQGNFPQMSFSDICLLSVSIFFTLFVENSSILQKLLRKIKENKITSEFESSLEKAKELKETFHEFLKSLGVSVSKMINMLSYTFIIPLLGFLVEYTKEGYLTSESSTEIGIRLASFGILTLSSKTLTVLFKKLINRFSS